MKNLSQRLFLGIGVFALIAIALELSGYIYLQHFNVDGTYESNLGIGNKLRKYLLNPADTAVQPRYLPQQTLGFTHNPLYYEGGFKQNNVYGWRGKDFNVIKPDSVFRIVCMGGSTTYGFGVVNPDSSYPAILQGLLIKQYSTKKIEVINAGLEAASSFEEIMNYLFKVRYLKPDAIVLKSGGNDAAENLEYYHRYSPDMVMTHDYLMPIPNINPGLRFLFRSYFFSAIYQIVQFKGVLRADSAKFGVAAQRLDGYERDWFSWPLDSALQYREYYSFQNNFNTLVSEIVKDSVQLYVLPFALNNTGNDLDNGIPRYHELNELNNQIMLETCKRYGGIWVPLVADSIRPEYWLGDDCHLNESGNAFTAQFVSRYLNILQ